VSKVLAFWSSRGRVSKLHVSSKEGVRGWKEGNVPEECFRMLQITTTMWAFVH